MRARYGLEDGREHSLTEVASRFSLSRERIRQLEIQALGRLRELARAEGLQRRLNQAALNHTNSAAS